MTLREQLDQAFKQAFKAKEKETLAGLRLLLAAIHNREIAKHSILSDEETVQLLRAEAKKRRASLEIYQKAGRLDLAEREKLDLEITERFLDGL